MSAVEHLGNEILTSQDKRHTFDMRPARFATALDKLFQHLVDKGVNQGKLIEAAKASNLAQELAKPSPLGSILRVNNLRIEDFIDMDKKEFKDSACYRQGEVMFLNTVKPIEALINFVRGNAENQQDYIQRVNIAIEILSNYIGESEVAANFDPELSETDIEDLFGKLKQVLSNVAPYHFLEGKQTWLEAMRSNETRREMLTQLVDNCAKQKPDIESYQPYSPDYMMHVVSTMKRCMFFDIKLT